MKLINLLNRRFFGERVDGLSLTFETIYKIDTALQNSGLLDPVDEQIIVLWYEGELLVGREVVGYDPALKPSLKDFPPIQMTRREDLELDLEKLEEEMKRYAHARGLLSPQGLIKLDFFE